MRETADLEEAATPEPCLLSSPELAQLIRLAVDGKSVLCGFGPSGARLRNVPENAWAFASLAEMRRQCATVAETAEVTELKAQLVAIETEYRDVKDALRRAGITIQRLGNETVAFR